MPLIAGFRILGGGGEFAARNENDSKKTIVLLLSPEKLQTDTVQSVATFILPLNW